MPSITLTSPKPIANAPLSLTTVGDHIKLKRLELGLLQKELAVIIGASSGAISRWEQNLTEDIPVKFIPNVTLFLTYCPIESFSNLGEKIFLYRKHLGLSQKQLSAKAGIDPSCLLTCENGRRTPKKDTCVKLEQILKTELR